MPHDSITVKELEQMFRVSLVKRIVNQIADITRKMDKTELQEKLILDNRNVILKALAQVLCEYVMRTKETPKETMEYFKSIVDDYINLALVNEMFKEKSKVWKRLN